MYVDIMIRIRIVRARGKCVKSVTVIAALFLRNFHPDEKCRSSFEPRHPFRVMYPTYFFASAQLLTSSS